MAETVVLYDGDGSTTAFTYPFDSLADTYVITTVYTSATNDDVTANFTVSLDYDTSIVTLSPAPAASEQVEIKRVTSASDDVFTFAAGSVIRPTDIEFALKSNRDIAEEARDQASAGPQGPQGPTGPQGETGAQGAAGDAATVTVGTVTTGTPGTSVVINNSGTTAAAILDFTIPQGAAGANGTGSGTVTEVIVGAGLSGADITSAGTISHADTSAQTNITATTDTFVDGLTFDGYGHVTGVTTSVVQGFDGAYGSLTGVPADFTPSAHTLSSHSDVSATAPTDGQALAWNNAGGTWEPQTISGSGSGPQLDSPTTADHSPIRSGISDLSNATTTTLTLVNTNLLAGDIRTVYNNTGAAVTLAYTGFTTVREDGSATDISASTTTLADKSLLTVTVLSSTVVVLSSANLTVV